MSAHQNLTEQLKNIGEKANSINSEPATLAQAKLWLNLFHGYEEEFSIAIKECEIESNATLDQISEAIKNLNGDIEATKNTIATLPNKSDQKKELKTKLKSTQDEVANLKKQLTSQKKSISAEKSEFETTRKIINKRTRELGNTVTTKEKAEQKAQEVLNKLNEKRHHIPAINFPSLEQNNNHSQNRMFSSNPEYQVFPINEELASEMTHALTLESFNAMLDEFAFLFAVNGEQVLVLFENGLKFSYSPETNEYIRVFNAHFNKDKKSWMIGFNSMDYNTVGIFHDYFADRFHLVVDLDNLLIYASQRANIFERLHNRPTPPIFTPLDEPIKVSKEALRLRFNEIYDQPEKGVNPFDLERGLSIFNPVTKKFQNLKKETLITTTVPHLLLRFSLASEIKFMILASDTFIPFDGLPDNYHDLVYQYRYRAQYTKPKDFLEINEVHE